MFSIKPKKPRKKNANISLGVDENVLEEPKSIGSLRRKMKGDKKPKRYKKVKGTKSRALHKVYGEEKVLKIVKSNCTEYRSIINETSIDTNKHGSTVRTNYQQKVDIRNKSDAKFDSYDEMSYGMFRANGIQYARYINGNDKAKSFNRRTPQIETHRNCNPSEMLKQIEKKCRPKSSKNILHPKQKKEPEKVNNIPDNDVIKINLQSKASIPIPKDDKYNNRSKFSRNKKEFVQIKSVKEAPRCFTFVNKHLGSNIQNKVVSYLEKGDSNQIGSKTGDLAKIEPKSLENDLEPVIYTFENTSTEKLKVRNNEKGDGKTKKSVPRNEESKEVEETSSLIDQKPRSNLSVKPFKNELVKDLDAIISKIQNFNDQNEKLSKSDTRIKLMSAIEELELAVRNSNCRKIIENQRLLRESNIENDYHVDERISTKALQRDSLKSSESLKRKRKIHLKLYNFSFPVDKIERYVKIKCPPFALLLEHTIAVIYKLFLQNEDTHVLSMTLPQLKWAYFFLKHLPTPEGKIPLDVSSCMEIIDEIICHKQDEGKHEEDRTLEEIERSVEKLKIEEIQLHSTEFKKLLYLQRNDELSSEGKAVLNSILGILLVKNVESGFYKIKSDIVEEKVVEKKPETPKIVPEEKVSTNSIVKDRLSKMLSPPFSTRFQNYTKILEDVTKMNSMFEKVMGQLKEEKMKILSTFQNEHGSIAVTLADVQKDLNESMKTSYFDTKDKIVKTLQKLDSIKTFLEIVRLRKGLNYKFHSCLDESFAKLKQMQETLENEKFVDCL